MDASRVNSTRCPKLQPSRRAPHTPALTCVWESCSHEGHERHGEMSLGTCDWGHAETEAAEDMAGNLFWEGGTPRWRAPFQGLQPWTTTAGKGHSWGTAAVDRDILESLCYGVAHVRVRTPLGVMAIADPCWGRGKPLTTKEKQTETIKHTTQNLLGHTFPHFRNWDRLSVTHGKNTGKSDQEGREERFGLTWAQIRKESLYFFVGAYSKFSHLLMEFFLNQ